MIAVNDDDAVATARDLARHEGLVVGISSGASVFASVIIARELGPGAARRHGTP